MTRIRISWRRVLCVPDGRFTIRQRQHGRADPRRRITSSSRAALSPSTARATSSVVARRLGLCADRAAAAGTRRASQSATAVPIAIGLFGAGGRLAHRHRALAKVSAAQLIISGDPSSHAVVHRHEQLRYVGGLGHAIGRSPRRAQLGHRRSSPSSGNSRVQTSIGLREAEERCPIDVEVGLTRDRWRW